MLYVLEYTIKTIKKGKGEKGMEGERRREEGKEGEEREKMESELAGGVRGAGGSSTVADEVLENTCELWVFVDIEKVWESLHHLLLLRRHRRACRYLSFQVLKRERSCPDKPVPRPRGFPSCLLLPQSSSIVPPPLFCLTFFSSGPQHPQAPCSPLGSPSLDILTCCYLTRPQLDCLVKNGTLHSPSAVPKHI